MFEKLLFRECSVELFARNRRMNRRMPDFLMNMTGSYLGLKNMNCNTPFADNCEELEHLL